MIFSHLLLQVKATRRLPRLPANGKTSFWEFFFLWIYIPSLGVQLFSANPSTSCVQYSPGHNGVPSLSAIVQFFSFLWNSLCFFLSGWLLVSTLHLLPHERAGSVGRCQQPFRIQGCRSAWCIFFTTAERGLKCVERGSSHQSAAQTPSTRESKIKKQKRARKCLHSFKICFVCWVTNWSLSDR